MTREEIIEQLNLAIGLIKQDGKDWLDDRDIPMLEECVKALSQEQDMTIAYLMGKYEDKEPCDDAISRDALKKMLIGLDKWHIKNKQFVNVGLLYDDVFFGIEQLPSVTQKSGKCKDCKWWKDSDGVYRRGVGAESKCPINNVSVNHGFGYCYMFKPQESEDKE